MKIPKSTKNDLKILKSTKTIYKVLKFALKETRTIEKSPEVYLKVL